VKQTLMKALEHQLAIVNRTAAESAALQTKTLQPAKATTSDVPVVEVGNDGEFDATAAAPPAAAAASSVRGSGGSITADETKPTTDSELEDSANPGMYFWPQPPLSRVVF
jgi:hypothetical protein